MNAFTDRENSPDSGLPFRLYFFERGAVWWAYTNAAQDIDFQGATYEALSIRDDGIRVTGETSANELTITLPDDVEIVKMFRGVAPSDDIWLTIRDGHHGLPDAEDSAAVVWVGSARAVKRPAPGRAEILCNSLSASMRSDGLRLSYERNCPHCLYDGNCRVLMENWRLAVTIEAADGASVTVSNLPEIYAGGIIEWTNGMYAERRGIEAQAGATLTLLGGAEGLAAGMTARLYPGCDQTSATCDGRFANMENYGGFRHLPGKSPFDGDPVF
ncbi:MAG: phage BR0599 family protein [Zoogloeaceae bacterium]|jgi:uncharacterized phage protein (TIGR02218 family)|nr:phage BR0599 family protein [Zoogloeaceae bacterium]